jgi:hypothetical protein
MGCGGMDAENSPPGSLFSATFFSQTITVTYSVARTPGVLAGVGAIGLTTAA